MIYMNPLPWRWRCPVCDGTRSRPQRADGTTDGAVICLHPFHQRWRFDLWRDQARAWIEKLPTWPDFGQALSRSWNAFLAGPVWWCAIGGVAGGVVVLWIDSNRLNKAAMRTMWLRQNQENVKIIAKNMTMLRDNARKDRLRIDQLEQVILHHRAELDLLNALGQALVDHGVVEMRPKPVTTATEGRE